MDDETVREATKRWVEAGVIDPETATAIREFEHERAEGGERDSLVVALSLMGAVLIGVGVLTFLATFWSSLSVATRTVVLLGVPLAAGGAGSRIARRGYPKVGHGLWFLGAAFIGPTLVLLADLHGFEPGAEWLLAAWALLALPAGHAFDSRPTTALGLVVALWATALAVPDESAPFVVAFAGTVVVAAGLSVRPGTEQLAGVYRIVGLVPVAGTLLVFGMQQGDYWLDPFVAVPALTVAAGGAAVAVGLVLLGWRRGERADADALAVTAPGVATLAGLAVVAVTPPLPALLSLLLVHAVLLGLLIAVVRVAVEDRSRALVNLVAAAFFLQVVTFLFSTVAEVLSASVTVIVAGIVLVGVGYGLERSRRQLLAEMEPS